MSYATPTAAGPERPSTVTISSLLLYLVAGLYLVGSAINVVSVSTLSKEEVENIYRQAGADKVLAETSAGVFSVVMYATAAFALVIAALLVVLAIFVGKGKQWARITTWVVGGILACCAFLGLVSQGASGMMSGSGTANGFDQVEAQKLIAEALPSWNQPVSLALGVIQLLALLAAVIMLALPPSHPFFRKVEPTWVPPSYPQA